DPDATASASASAVLPTPPAPVNVVNGTDATLPATSAISRSLPTSTRARTAAPRGLTRVRHVAALRRLSSASAPHRPAGSRQKRLVSTRPLEDPLEAPRSAGLLFEFVLDGATARRIDTERSSASASRRTSSRVSGGNRTGTISVRFERFRRRAGPWGSWFSGLA